jgi:hypothetical protein
MQKQVSLAKKRARTLVFISLLTATMLGCRPQPVCVDFESIPVGTFYGSLQGQHPGYVVVTEEKITVSLDNLFASSGGQVYFDFAEVLSPPYNFGSGNAIHLTNISLAFEFEGLGFDSQSVSFDYMDFGEREYVLINDVAESGDLADMTFGAPTSLPVTISETAVGGGQSGTFSIAGDVNDLLIGAENLWIDRVCVTAQ